MLSLQDTFSYVGSYIVVEETEEDKKKQKKANDEVSYPNLEFSEDTYGMACCSCLRDSYMFHHQPQGQRIPRLVRIAVVLFLLFFTIYLQVFLISRVKKFVSAQAVHDIRNVYDEFETFMCGKENTVTLPRGFKRCKPGRFPAFEVAKEKFSKLPLEKQGPFCRIPLTQPGFFFTILIIWTLTCMREVRVAYVLQYAILAAHTIDSMKDAENKAARQMPGDDDEDDDDLEKVVIRGVTGPVKLFVTVLNFVRVGMTLYLCWVGCRWLLGTNIFSDLILNAVALEFILLIKEGIYMTLMPSRSKRDRELTSVHPGFGTTGFDIKSQVNTLILLVISSVWVLLYMFHLQDVLPDYEWDVHSLCNDYYDTRYHV